MLDNLILGAIIVVGCYFAFQMFSIARMVLMNPLNDLPEFDNDPGDNSDSEIDLSGANVEKNELILDDNKRVESETIILKKDRDNE